MPKKGKLVKTIFNIGFWLIIGVIFLITLFMLLTKQEESESSNVFGYSPIVVLKDSPSMEGPITEYDIPTIKSQSLIIIKNLPAKNEEEFIKSLKVGDVITFKCGTGIKMGKVITHRIIQIDTQPVGDVLTYRIVAHGDNNPESDVEIVTNSTDTEGILMGKVVWVNYGLGLAYYFLISVYGLVFVVILPSTIMIIVEVTKIIKIVDKKKSDKMRAQLLQEISTGLDRPVNEVSGIAAEAATPSKWVETEKKEASPPVASPPVAPQAADQDITAQLSEAQLAAIAKILLQNPELVNTVNPAPAPAKSKPQNNDSEDK